VSSFWKQHRKFTWRVLGGSLSSVCKPMKPELVLIYVFGIIRWGMSLAHFEDTCCTPGGCCIHLVIFWSPISRGGEEGCCSLRKTGSLKLWKFWKSFRKAAMLVYPSLNPPIAEEAEIKGGHREG